jgi:hypothetical protein
VQKDHIILKQYLGEKLKKQMTWPMERPFSPEEVRQLDVGSSGAGGAFGNGDHDIEQGSEEQPDN